MSGKRSAMRPRLRKAAIIDFVDHRGKASVEELAEKFATSPETVRRDLNTLADAGRVRKVHGGALRIRTFDEGPLEDRLTTNALAKQLVAEKLTKTVLPNQSLLIDTGSTTLFCAEALAKVRNLTVITNSTRIAAVFAGGSGGAKVILLGGTFNGDNAQTVGPTTISEVGRFRTDHAILTIGTLDEKGAADFSEEEAQVACAMINAADKVTLVADSSKMSKRSTFHVCNLNEIDRLVLEKPPCDTLLEALKTAKVEVL